MRSYKVSHTRWHLPWALPNVDHKFLPKHMQIDLMCFMSCWKGFAIWGQGSVFPPGLLKKFSWVLLCLCGSPTYSMIIYASPWPEGVTCWKVVFIPDVVWRKFGRRARNVSELFFFSCIWREIFSFMTTQIQLLRRESAKGLLLNTIHLRYVQHVKLFVLYRWADAVQAMYESACVWGKVRALLSLFLPRSVSHAHIHIQCGLMRDFLWKRGL